MSNEPVWDNEKGELRILGQRHTAIDVQALCNHLDALTGPKVSEVIMHSLEFHLGKSDAARHKAANPNDTLTKLVAYLAKSDRLSGLGITNVTLPDTPLTSPITIEISNPSVKGTTGAAKSFLFSWWAGAMSSLLDREMDARDVLYDEDNNVMKCKLTTR